MPPGNIEIILPHHQPVSTIGPTMSLDEQVAHEKTLKTVLSTIFKEADHLMKHEEPRAYEQAISQAWGYTNTMMTRRATANRRKANRPDTDLLEARIIAQETIATGVATHRSNPGCAGAHNLHRGGVDWKVVPGGKPGYQSTPGRGHAGASHGWAA